MKSRLLSAYALASLCLVSSLGIARNPTNGQPAHPANSNKTEIGTCTVPSSQFDLEINNVRARVLNAGDVWWDLSNGKYEVPKGDKTSSTAYPQAIFAGAIWVSALDQGNNLRMAAQTYRQSGTTDFYAGPLDVAGGGTVSASSCNAWNRHFNVLASEIKPLVDAHNAAPLSAVPGNLVTNNILTWPGKGNMNCVSLGIDSADMRGILAPFFDANGDGIYNPFDGDYPTIKQGGTRHPLSDAEMHDACDTLHYTTGTAYADQMIFWVMNDKGNVHTATNGTPMGIQVNALAFAFQSSDEINNMTFYTYNIINKSGTVFKQAYMSQWTDVDLGCANNDRVGCDTTRSMAIAYNGSSPDAGSVCPTGEVGYGTSLPMLGIDFFEGPTDTTLVVDPSTGIRKPKQLGMSSFCYFNISGQPTTGDPQSAVQYRNYQTGFWQNGTPITYGGSGYGYSNLRINYAFPGDPAIATQWSECNPQLGPAIPAGDRRFVQTAGPFTFLPCAVEPITIGVVFVQPTGGVGSTCPSWNGPLANADDKAQALFDNHFEQLVGPTAPNLGVRELSNRVIINILNDEGGTNAGETFAKVDPLRVRKGFKSPIYDTISRTPALVVKKIYLDSLYKFQGYVLYQLADETVSANDLGNSAKAVPIAVYDIADDVKLLTNWDPYVDPSTNASTWVPEAGTTIPGVGNKLPNTGVQHSYIDSLDHINGGKLINYHTYYYGIISFATNNFKTFVPDSGVGQSQPFLIGKNLNKYSAIPHDVETENGGRTMGSNFGAATVVQRIEGQGNGGNYLNLTPETIDLIVKNQLSDNYFSDTMQYYQKGYDPLAFKIIDPVAVKEADFELKIYDTVPYNGVSVSPKAWWVLNDLTNNVSIRSQRSLDRPYEQIISADAADVLGTQYGFSLTLGTPFPVYTNQVNNQPIYGPIGGTITFADPSQPWLSFVKDAGASDVTNWIRSGSTTAPCAASNPDPLCNVFEDSYYKVCSQCPPILTDPDNLFSSIAGGTWAPYCLAANWSTGPNPQVTGRTVTSVAGPAFKWDAYNDKASSPENTLDQLQSVDIVITSDKSKWTQCVVFETGDNPILGDIPDPTGGNVPPRKGMLRNHLGLDKDGHEITDPALSSSYYGTSWFPGYAVNLETGKRLNMAFGEASDEGDQNGRDMIWNPTSTLFGTFNTGTAIPYKPILGGMHYIYVMNTLYDNGAQWQTDFYNEFGIMTTTLTGSQYDNVVRSHYKEIMWTAMPYLTPGYSLKSIADGLIPNDVTIKLRVQKPYAKLPTTATGYPSVTKYRYFTRIDSTWNATHDTVMHVDFNPDSTAVVQDSFPRFKFSTKGLGPKENQADIAKSSLDLIRVVPNPYLAYSAYEKSANDSRVKVTNLPNACTIKIYTLDGVLVKTIQRAVSLDPVKSVKEGKDVKVELSEGYDLNDQTGSSNLDNSVEWDLKNEKAIPVGSGIYLFDIEVPGVGHKILKWFGTMRPTDVSNF